MKDSKKQKKNIYFITGAEGVGKTSIIPLLKKEFPKIDFHDFDDVGVPENPDLQWRIDTTIHWINKSIKNQSEDVETCILGLSFPKEIMNFKEFKKLKNVLFILLDISKEEREKRLTKRGDPKNLINYTGNLLNLRLQMNDIKGKIIITSGLSIVETFKKVRGFINMKYK